ISSSDNISLRGCLVIMHRKKFKNNNFNSLNNSLEPNYDPMVKCLINNIIILCHEIQQINLFNDNYMKDFLIFLPIYSAVPHTNLTPQFASNIPQLSTWMDLVQLMGYKLSQGSHTLLFPMESHQSPLTLFCKVELTLDCLKKRLLMPNFDILLIYSPR
ncbi:MAG: hypothetical protein Q8851_00735, partial [Sweet potato little leaf phytoplasma]|nr:hypothetical protein [Sweet potato little leaf phytoplasma]